MKKKDRLSIPVTVSFEGKRKQFLKHLIEKNNFKTMIEVGIDTGKTTFFLLDNIPDLTIYAIDKNINKFYTEDVKQRYKERLIPLQGMSHIVADKIKDGIADLVFIDADHSYEAVKRDIEKYSPKLKVGGLLTGHDIDYPGVNQAVTEVVKTFDVGPNYVWIKR